MRSTRRLLPWCCSCLESRLAWWWPSESLRRERSRNLNKADCLIDAVEMPLSLLHSHTLCLIGLHYDVKLELSRIFYIQSCMLHPIRALEFWWVSEPVNLSVSLPETLPRLKKVSAERTYSGRCSSNCPTVWWAVRASGPHRSAWSVCGRTRDLGRWWSCWRWCSPLRSSTMA